MQLSEGADVYTAGGDRIGTVSRVLVAPDTKQATHLIVMREYLNQEENVISTRLIESATTERITLCSNAENLIELPDPLQARALSGTHPCIPRQEMFGAMLTLFQYPPVGSWWVAGSHSEDAPHILAGSHDAPFDGTDTPTRGAGVYSCDGVYVGGVERSFMAPGDHRITHIVLCGGELFGWRKLLHACWLAELSGGEVHLSVDADFVDNLPDYQIYD